MNQPGQLRWAGFTHEPELLPERITRRDRHYGDEKGRMTRTNMPVPIPRTGIRAQPVSREVTARRQRRFPTSFCSTLRRTPPPIPPNLLRFVSELEQEKNSQNIQGSQPAKKKDAVGPGRVKVLLRVCPEEVLPSDRSSRGEPTSNRGSILRVEGNRKHVTIFDSESGLQSAQIRVGVSAPKLYAFDAVFPEDASQIEVCSASLIDVIQAVVQGADGAVFCYGHSGLGKTYTLIGSDVREGELGLIPCAISWLYRAIDEMKEKTKGRFSVRVSAVEVYGRTEQLNDLLKGYAKDDAPGEDLCVREDPLFGTQLQNQCEVRASSAEKAAHLLDAALSSRSSSRAGSTEEARRHSHMVYTLHVYQYRLDKSGKTGVSGGRSRLHFIDLGSCERTLVKTPNSLTLSLNSLGHVIMAIINNSKHVPFKESKLTLVLQDLLGNFNCRTVMLAHVARSANHYADTMSTVQMASRIHRVLLKKKTKAGAGSVRGIGCRVSKSMKPHRMRGTDDESLGTSSGVGETSGSEVSCDTVIYVRPNGVPYSDRELTDNEGPPPSVPIRTPPKSAKSLSKIAENEQADSGLKHGPKYQQTQSTIPKRQNQATRLPVAKGHAQANGAVSNTQQKIANHAKLLSNIGDSDRRNPRIPNSSEKVRSDRKFETTASDKRKPSKAPSARHEKKSPIKTNLKSNGGKTAINKSKIPPPPPPRLPTTRLTRNPELNSIRETSANFRRARDGKSFHQPTYETLHASHSPRENTMPSSKQNDTEATDQSIGANTEEANAVNGMVDLNIPINLPADDGNGRKFVKVRHVSGGREKQDGCDVITGAGRDISRCIQDFNDLLNSVDEGDVNSIRDMTSQPSVRPDSMLVNVNENDWDSDDDDTFTGENDVSDGDDVIDVNFYCLSFSTKNPLIPLSKRSFVRQVNTKKRLSLEGRGNGEKSMSDTSWMGGTKWAERVNRTFPPEKCDSNGAEDDFKAEICNGPASEPTDIARLSRSRTFEVESEFPVSILPDGSCPEDETSSMVAEAIIKSPEEGSVSIDGNSTVSSPSQVLLYDSSSLEINYVKPKSFCDRNRSLHTCDDATHMKTGGVKKYDAKSPTPKTCFTSRIDERGAKGDKLGKTVLVTGSGNHQGAQLSLIRSSDAATTLELVITSEHDATSGCEVPPNEKPGNIKRIIGGKKSSQDGSCKESPAKRSKWPALRRFGGKKEKLPGDRGRAVSPAKEKSSKKVENQAVESIKAASSSGSSFVSKLLSPKIKRNQKTSNGTSTSTDFRYRSPNTVSQMRPDIVRTTNSFTNRENLETFQERSELEEVGHHPAIRRDINTSHISGETAQRKDKTRPTPTRNRFGFTKKPKS